MDLSLVPYVEPAPAERCGGRYRECMRNHAAAMGGQAYDGCCEFMAGEEEALKCAACGCHRNFHRREGSPSRHQLVLYDRKHSVLPAPAPVAFFPPSLPFHQIPPTAAPLAAGDSARGGSETPPRREELGATRKRYRTKFTSEQREKMREFADKLGWRIQKHDDEALDEFCVEIGVKRHVLKVWMHNHKTKIPVPSADFSSSASAAVDREAAPPAPTIRV
ncbi:ZF-HD homeobox protein [Apostasia shenzhenica]|uniref:ZF-HD homeobox protein n=1 Tax=Apostasia shenzhenica TaxID=1088818 RepID=A0A2I0BG55_9ASPA|nr:ZF-HD homeobox protein [Apostasia shenzhenica]